MLSIFGYIQYFTFINIVFILGHKYIHKYINILYTSLLVSVFGFMFFNICPGRFSLRIFDRTVTLSGTPLMLIDILIHHLPTLFVLYWYLQYYTKHPFDLSFYVAIMIIIIYFISLREPFDIYACYDKKLIVLTHLIVLAIYGLIVCVAP
jgi:hypothetical protein